MGASYGILSMCLPINTAVHSRPYGIEASTICHGSDLRGIGPVPPIAGRSAIYTFRQLYDFKDGARHGAWSAMMKPVVQNLTLDDMIAITAYTSSRMP